MTAASTRIAGVGPQHPRAAAGTDPRGWLVFDWLPPALGRAEDATAAADYTRGVKHSRPATDTERALLTHLGYVVPTAELITSVSWPSPGVRCRRWKALEGQKL
jgi:hypothetical protein